MPETMSPEARAAVLQRRASALAHYQRAMVAMSKTLLYSDESRVALDEANEQFDLAQTAEAEYFTNLLEIPISICPFDGQPLVRFFDPYGLDGPWWRSSATPQDPLACRHFCTLVGAVSFEGQPPRGGEFEAHVGPQVPFVIPRLLEQLGMIAVLSRIRMANGYLAYPIAYFAERRPPPQALTASWARTNYLYETQLGEIRWRIPVDPWDFDLGPWLESGKLRWCVSDGQNLNLSAESSSTCPYVGLPGERRPTVVKGERFWFDPPPGVT